MNTSKTFTRTITLLTILVSIIMGVLLSRASAQSEDDLDFVYGTNHYNGATFSSTLIPSNVNTVYLLAENTSIVAGRFTDIYYWPITNEFKADWDKYNIIVEGSIEILKNGKLIQSVDLTEYVIQYDANNQIDTTVLYLGEDAIAARSNYEKAQKQYRDDLYAYYQVLNEYTVRFQEALGKLQAGLITEDQLPEQPIPLPDFSLFSTDLLFGFPINLAVGDYDICLRLPDGSIQADSCKQLVVYKALADGIGYEISGEERWNLPENSLSDTETIYGLKGGSYFIKPVHQKLYNEQFYIRMNNPQNKTARADREIWVPFRSAENVTLRLVGQTLTQDISLQQYYVNQILGSKLGFNILPFDPETMTSPTFTGFKLILSDSLVYKLSLVDHQGQLLPGSEREIRIVNTNRTWLIYLMSILPLFLGIIIVFWRRRSVRDIKVVGVG